MSTRARFLAALASGDRTRPDLVESLRAAAARIEDTAHLSSFGSATGAEVPGAIVNAHHTIAAQLRDAAQRLCDHVRISSDGRCRYCDLLVGLGFDE